ncbi:hypothetical protein DYBT9623_03138 [Dyadobacter sp. CECT 9623]|jgi:magnesium-transporting ATPase (P-type)|uniref:Uncharacterized protein n=1 Tax=Dyadobacter linearis TaxID=2823330 RepID=A0ABN7RCZ0_9BACT|nr:MULTISPECIES: hypothetical protein [unclassified Dyadobacter]MCE7061593.1 hypothetical protein [Dyadobacter sp. CY343]CAG5070592.1 hypothetical protein DYBT9623_03138 [Dyadobacter sp. CECT 9623]
MPSPNIVQNVADVINSQSDIPDQITTDSQVFATRDPRSTAGYAEEKNKAELESYRQDTQERKKYAKLIFWMVALWLFGIFVIILMVGFKTIQFKQSNFNLDFTLSNEVTIALITTTTINVAAFFLAVTKYLFPNRGRGND